MYLAGMLFKIAYVLENISVYNVVLLLAVGILYDRRAGYEETQLLHDATYREYTNKVRYRFIPGLY
ncbi:hypothetical protein ACFL6U_24310 [Planctomycetota bacterium]